MKPSSTPFAPSRITAPATAWILLASLATAQEPGWNWSVTPYAWATDVGIDTRLAGRQVVNESIPVEDLIEDLDATFQGRLEGRVGEHGLLADVFYVSMSDDVSGFQLPNGAGTGDLEWNMKMSLFDIAATYDTAGDGLGVSYLYGVRVVDQRTRVDAALTTAGGTSQQNYNGSDTLVDALLGVRYAAQLTPSFRLQTELTASTGGTESTWSASPTITWSFSKQAELLVGYRHMEIDFKEQGGVDTEMSLSGPLLGCRVSL